MLSGKRILLVISGGIACYKSLDLIRRMRERGATVQTIMTASAQEFITPLAVGALSADKVFTELFDRESEQDVGHIRLARDADLIIVAPATANLMARMAHGLADDLSTAVLLATSLPVLIAPAMNPKMWSHPATQRNVATLKADGLHFIGPNSGEMAESNESGTGRMAEPLEIVAAAEKLTGEQDTDQIVALLKSKHVLVTSGPTHEPIDPVRYLANRSSGKQGHAIAAAAARAGAKVTLVSGPVTVPDPQGVNVIRVETARQMLEAVKAALPADVAVMAAAVADWHVSNEGQQKLKKDGSGRPPTFELIENPDILATVGHHESLRPELLIGFAAETQNVIANAKGKLDRKKADWIIANDVSPQKGVMGGDMNTVHVVSHEDVEDWPLLNKQDVAVRLIERISRYFGSSKSS